MAYRFIKQYQSEFGLRWLLNRMRIFPNAYYNYLKHKKESYHSEKETICGEIKELYHETGGILGHRSMRVFLTRKNIFLSKTTLHKYMNKELRLLCICRKKRPGYRKGTAHKIFPNLLKKNLIAQTKNQILHSDQRSQFTSSAFILYCMENGIIQSMSGAGCPYDNAPMERYYNTLKAELINRFHFHTDEELKLQKHLTLQTGLHR